MCCKLAYLLLLVVAASQAKIIQVTNSGSVALVVSITDQKDQIINAKRTVSLSMADNWKGEISAIPENAEVSNGPRTIATISLGTTDKYSISLKEGWNLKTKIVPMGGKSCNAAVCSADLNKSCPPGSKVTNSSGAVVACKNNILMSKKCPKAVVSSENAKNVMKCNAAAYKVLIG